MTAESLAALAGLALVASWTPGPNNTLLAASGANFGLRATLPHVLGIALGFPVMIFLVGLGLGGLFAAVPALAEVLRWVGAAIMLWLAWRIAQARPDSDPAASTRHRPFRLHEAAAFQWINPKGWVMAVAISAQFVRPEDPAPGAATVAAVFVAAGLGSALGWAGFGVAMRRLMGPEGLVWFNRAMAAGLAGLALMLAAGA